MLAKIESLICFLFHKVSSFFSHMVNLLAENYFNIYVELYFFNQESCYLKSMCSFFPLKFHITTRIIEK